MYKRTLNHVPHVGVVLVTWNNLKDTLECLESLKKIIYKNYSVVLVDNNSSDGTVRYISKTYKNIQIIKNTQNYGYAKAVNIGIRKLLRNNHTKYVLLLNNDTVVKNNFLSALINRAEIDESIGMVSSKMYYYDRPRQLWYAGATVKLEKGIIAHNTQEFDGRGQKIRACETGYCTGCSTLYRLSMFKKIELFDESYISYVEDVELSLRAQNSGYKIYYEPKSVIWHKVSASQGNGSLKKEYLKTKNAIRLYRKYAKRYLFQFMTSKLLESAHHLMQLNIYSALGIYKGLIEGQRIVSE